MVSPAGVVLRAASVVTYLGYSHDAAAVNLGVSTVFAGLLGLLRATSGLAGGAAGPAVNHQVRHLSGPAQCSSDFATAGPFLVCGAHCLIEAISSLLKVLLQGLDALLVGLGHRQGQVHGGLVSFGVDAALAVRRVLFPPGLALDLGNDVASGEYVDLLVGQQAAGPVPVQLR
jgi:hypothetical protein